MFNDDVNNNILFRIKCSEYGLDRNKFKIFNNVILVKTPISDLYVILDYNFNTIGVETKKFYELEENFANDFYKKYCNYKDVVQYGENFEYPFNDYTLKNFIDIGSMLSDDPKIFEKNFKERSKEYYQILSYIKFIYDNIKKYFITYYHFQVMGFEAPNIYLYIRTLNEKINECIDIFANNNMKPLPNDILNFIGRNFRMTDSNKMLSDIIDLKNVQNDLSIVSNEILKDIKSFDSESIQELKIKKLSYK